MLKPHLTLIIFSFNRSDSPGTLSGTRRRSSAQNLTNYGRSTGRSASLTPSSLSRLSSDYNVGSNNSTPRGSLSNINNVRGRAASLNTSNLKFQQGTVSLKTAAMLNNSRLSSGASPQLSRRTNSKPLLDNNKPEQSESKCQISDNPKVQCFFKSHGTRFLAPVFFLAAIRNRFRRSEEKGQHL